MFSLPILNSPSNSLSLQSSSTSIRNPSIHTHVNDLPTFSPSVQFHLAEEIKGGKMECVLARRGRHRQRYEDNRRLVSGCIPYRLIKEGGDQSGCVKDALEVLMICTPNRSDLVFPKGGWEDDESMEDAACREALEEAGVKGILNKNHLGVWEFRSKSRQELCTQGGGCRGYMFALEVVEELDTWPEQENHNRRWLRIEEAYELCRYDWMRDALTKFLNVMMEQENRSLNVTSDATDPAGMVVPVVQDCHSTSSDCFVSPSNTELVA